VIDRAQRFEIEVPINRAARDLVWEIARSEAQPGVQTLHALYERTRR
jgi:hypothetical protein